MLLDVPTRGNLKFALENRTFKSLQEFGDTGTADDYLTFEAAFASGYNIWIPEGDYTVSVVDIDTVDGLIIAGPGNIISTTPNTSHNFYFQDCDNIIIDGLSFDSVKASRTAGDIIRAHRTDNITITNCKFVDAINRAIILRSVNNAKITNCTFIDNNLSAISLAADTTDGGTSNITISNNTIQYTTIGEGTQGTAGTGGKAIGAYTSVGYGATIDNITVTNNIIQYPISTSYDGSTSSSDHYGYVQVEMFGEINRVAISNNNIIGSRMAISIAGADDVSITGNTIYQPKDYGVEITKGSNNVVVDGNTITGLDNDDTTDYTKGIGLQAPDADGDVEDIILSNNIITKCIKPFNATPTTFDNMREVLVIGNHIKSTAKTTGFSEVNKVHDITFINNTVDMGNTDAIYGIKFIDCDGIVANNNTFINMFTGAAAGDTSYPILLSSSAHTTTLTHLECKYNSFDGFALVNNNIQITGYRQYATDSGYDVSDTATFDVSDNVNAKVRYQDIQNGNPYATRGDVVFLNDGVGGSSAITDIIVGHEGKEVTFIIANAAGDIGFTHTTNQLELAGGVNFYNIPNKTVIKFKRVSSSVWREIYRMIPLAYPVQLPNYTVANLPTTANTGTMAYCTNETGGAVPVFYDGTNWRRVTDRTVAA